MDERRSAARTRGTVSEVEPFLAAEALAAGTLSRYALAADHRRLLPGVHAPRRSALSLEERIVAAWLWSRRAGVVSGLAAAALHGTRWIANDIPIELNHPHNKSPAGVIITRVERAGVPRQHR